MKKIVAIVLSLVLVGTVAVQTPVYAAPDAEVETVTSSEVLSDSAAEDGFATFEEEQPMVYGMRTLTNVCGENLTWALESGTLTISGTGPMSNYTVKDNVGTAPWFSQADEITAVVIDSGVTEIGTYAFYGLDHMQNVTIPDTVTEIKGGAFFMCKSLRKAELPASVKKIGNGAFSGCVSMETFSAEGLEKIGAYTFEKTALTQFKVPKSLTSIDDLSFYNCKIEAFMADPENEVYSSALGILYGNEEKKIVAYPNGDLKTAVQIEGNVTEIAAGAFYNNDTLEAVTLPEGLSRVEKNTFYNCDNLDKVTVPANVDFVHPMAFPFDTEVTCLNTELKNYAGTGYRIMQEVSIDVEENYDFAYAVLELINAEREVEEVAPLKMNESLLNAAMKRAGEVALLYAHTRPDGTSCFTVNRMVLAENIAVAQTTPEQVVEEWMQSEKHRKNILSDEITSIGIGCIIHNGQYYWTQCFGATSDTENCAKPANAKTVHNVLLSLEPFGDASSKLADIYDVNKGTTTFEPKLVIANKKIAVGESTTAEVMINNPGYSLVSAKICSTGLTWTSSKEDVASVGTDGELVVNGLGSTLISGKMDYYNLSTPFVLGVERLSGKTRFDTSLEIADALKASLGVEKFSAAIVATGTNYADALSGSYLAYVKDAPILLVNEANEAKVKDYIGANVEPGGMIYILGGTAAVPEAMDDIEGYEVKRLYGKSRYDTNIAILEESGVESKELLVVTGANYADSLSASAAGRPLLLVKGDTLTDAQASYIEEFDPEKIYIIGGSAAVSENMKNAVSSYGETERVSGSSRYETSVKVANEFFKAPSAAVLAYAQNFPDGLCGGPLAASMNAPLILTSTNNEAVAAYYTDFYEIGSGAVLGGAPLISDVAVKEVFGLESVEEIINK